MQKISVIIPTYNSARTILQTIEAVKNQEGLVEPAEIIIVDDGSNDETLKLLAEIDNIKVLSQKNSGPATARNLGAKNSKGEILVFTDSDTIPHKNWLKELTTPFENSDIKASTGTYSIANPNSKLAQLIQVEIEYKHSMYSEFVLFGGSYNFAIRKTLFDEIGGFNESYKSASGEDNDICYKILNKCYKIKFIKYAVVGHYHPEELIKYMKTQFKHGYWRAKLYYDFPKRVSGDSYTGYKEILETLASGALFFSPLLFILNTLFYIIAKDGSMQASDRRIFKILFLIPIMILFFLELSYVSKIYSKANSKTIDYLPSKLYSAFIFSLRAILRTLGFVKGLFYIKLNSK